MSVIDIVIGFDFGIKRIGIAIGQKLTGTAQPLTVLKSKFGIPNWKSIETIYNDWKPMTLIVGLPLQLDGKEQPITVLAKKFAIQLKNRFHITVKMHDERFSTNEARLIQNENYFHNIYIYKKNQIDAIAAGIILKSWLNHT